MDYNMDPLSSMLLGDLELFPECALTNGLDKNEPLDIFRDQECLGTTSTPSLTDDVFPDWLDLKMDMAVLEGLETPDVLDDLLLGEVTAGQSLDTLPALQVGAKAYTNPLDTDHLPHQLVNSQSSRMVSPLSNLKTSPPNSPDWQVPDVIFCSPTSFFSQFSEPGSPGCVIKSASPAPALDPVVTPVAPIVVPPVALVVTAETSAASPVLPLDGFLSLPFSFESEIACVQMIQQSVISSEESSPPSTPPPLLPQKAKRNKIKAARNLRATKMKAAKLTEKDSDDDIYFSAPISKKERKRKQNKDAALRYRMKKRLETDVLSEEENLLLQENKKLKDKAQQLSNELGYLKNLMREMFKVKGLL